MKEALFYEREEDHVICRLCPHHCKIEESRVGKCGVRKNIANQLYSLNYGEITAVNIDPIEKKPLFHFMPKTPTLSIGSYGCNLSCDFCQNYHISKEFPSNMWRQTQEGIVEMALKYQLPSISYTYNEPTVFYEFVLDTAEIAKKKKLKNILVTNGFIEKEPLEQLLLNVDAVNIDLKSFREENYRRICKGHLEPVKQTIQLANEKCHVEVTTLVVTGMNDQQEELTDLFRWLASVNPNIPLHLSRYFPRYQYQKPPTDISFMERMQIEAKKVLKYVYLGNV